MEWVWTIDVVGSSHGDDRAEGARMGSEYHNSPPMGCSLPRTTHWQSKSESMLLLFIDYCICNKLLRKFTPSDGRVSKVKYVEWMNIYWFQPATSTWSDISLLSPVKEGFFYEDEPRDLPITEGSCIRDDYMHVAYVSFLKYILIFEVSYQYCNNEELCLFGIVMKLEDCGWIGTKWIISCLQVMDVVILHDGCRKYTNRLLAAAVMYEIYDADDAIGQVTG